MFIAFQKGSKTSMKTLGYQNFEETSRDKEPAAERRGIFLYFHRLGVSARSFLAFHILYSC